MVPPGYKMLSDRGFYGTAHFYPNYNRQLTPSFLDGRDRFTNAEVQSDYEICKLRYTCEVAYARVTNEEALKDVIPYQYFPYFDAINHWAHAQANFRKPLQV